MKLTNSYAIAVMKCLPGSLSDSVVGHLHVLEKFLDILIILLFMVQVCPAKLLMYIIDDHRLCKGGLEIPYEVTVTMNYSQENVRAMAEYTRLIQEKYEEPTDGHFPDATQTILDSLKFLSDDEEADDTDDDEEQPIAS